MQPHPTNHPGLLRIPGPGLQALFFVKSCHQRGIRVVFDVVMNMFAMKRPLAALASPWFYEPKSPGRDDYGQILFRFNPPANDNYFAAREFLCEMAEFWVSEYHVDGFCIDDFKDINNWDFVQEFHDRATAKSHGPTSRNSLRYARRIRRWSAMKWSFSIFIRILMTTMHRVFLATAAPAANLWGRPGKLS